MMSKYTSTPQKHKILAKIIQPDTRCCVAHKNKICRCSIIDTYEIMYNPVIKWGLFQIDISYIKGELAYSLPLPQHTKTQTKNVDNYIYIYTFNMLLYLKINIRITVLKYFVFYFVQVQIKKLMI